MAKVMWPAKETQSIMDWEKKVQRERRPTPEGVRDRVIWRERRMKRAR